MKTIKNHSMLRYFKIYTILASTLFMHCTLLQPFTVDECSQYNYKLGTLKLYMPDEVEAFIRITPQLTANKSIIFYITAKTIFNGNTTYYDHVRMNLHGESSLSYPRKSLELQFDDEDYFFNYPDITDEFFIISMEEDSGYFNNYLGYSFLKRMNLFFSHFEYIKVYINDSYEGLYLFVEKTQEAVKKRFNSVMAVYRKHHEKFYLKYLNDFYIHYGDSMHSALASLNTLMDQYTGDTLLNEITKFLDFDSYCQWLALNKLLKNGDYSDEAFFYALSQNDSFLFKVTGWDYEDIFKPPHGNNGFENSLVYCSEYKFDRAIANDSILYNNYRENLKKILTSFITPEFIDSIKNEIETRLIPLFYHKPTAKIMNNFSTSSNDAPKELKELIDSRFNFIFFHRDSILSIF